MLGIARVTVEGMGLLLRLESSRVQWGKHRDAWYRESRTLGYGESRVRFLCQRERACRRNGHAEKGLLGESQNVRADSPKARMRSETFRNPLLGPSQIRGLVEILLATIVAPYDKGPVQRGAGRKIVSYSKRDFVPKENAAPEMKPTVLAKYDPTIVSNSPHTRLDSIEASLNLCSGTRRDESPRGPRYCANQELQCQIKSLTDTSHDEYLAG